VANFGSLGGIMPAMSGEVSGNQGASVIGKARFLVNPSRLEGRFSYTG